MVPKDTVNSVYEEITKRVPSLPIERPKSYRVKTIDTHPKIHLFFTRSDTLERVPLIESVFMYESHAMTTEATSEVNRFMYKGERVELIRRLQEEKSAL